jgi:transposase/DNA-binding CsgD family transcriptional regulator
MARTGRPKVELVLTGLEREELERYARRPKTAQALALRARIVLESASGAPNTEVGARLGVTVQTVGKWRRRFVERRLAGLLDEPRPGQPRKITDQHVEDVIVRTLETTPPDDPLFIEKVRDIVGVYLDPPERAVVLCVDEKSQIQALDRSAPILPLLAGVPERRTHDYKRAGTSTLFAALDLATGHVIGSLHQRHRAVEFKKFLQRLDREVPDELEVHLILDNYATHKTPAIQKWLTVHPRFVLHFTPTSASWLNLVERWFAELTERKLRRGTHRTVTELNTDIRDWITNWNENPRPYVWVKTADQILDNLTQYLNRINDSRH